MSTEENEKVILHWFETLNQGDISLLDQLADELFTPDFCSHDPSMLDFEPGPTGVKKFIRELLTENSGVHVTLHDIFTHEEKTAYRFSVTMTDIASGKPVNAQLIAIDRFDGGRIAEEWQLSNPGSWR
jgi:ketosteroid isomerase-like protein